MKWLKIAGEILVVTLYVAGVSSAVLAGIHSLQYAVLEFLYGTAEYTILPWFFLIPFTGLYVTKPVKKIINEIAEMVFRL